MSSLLLGTAAAAATTTTAAASGWRQHVIVKRRHAEYVPLYTRIEFLGFSRFLFAVGREKVLMDLFSL
jgi:hypothetical protein